MSLLTFTNTGNTSGLMMRVERAVAELDPLVAEALVKVGDQMLQALHDDAPMGTGRTGGHLADSFYTHNEDLSLLVFTQQPEKYLFVTKGTKTPIRPVHARMLHSPELPHPMHWVRGQNANDFAQRVFDQTTQYMEEFLIPMGHQIALIIEGG